MKTLAILSVVCVVLEQQVRAAGDPVAVATQSVATSLYRVLRSQDSNVFFSPLSISTAFAILSAGAKGFTAFQIRQIFRGQVSMDLMRKSFAHYLTLINASDSSAYTLDMAVAAWIKQDVSVLKSFKDIIKSDFHTTISNADFIKKGQQVKNEINQWVNTKTRQKIPTLLEEPLSSDTVLFLANAIYFKGQWENKFKAEFTQKQVFYNNGDERQGKEVLMMYKDDKILYYISDMYKVIQLPYKGKNISMIVVLPTDFGNLDMVERILPENFIEYVRNRFDKTQIQVSLPKFKMEYSKKLKQAFQEIGLTSLFDISADFSGITGGKAVQVSEIMHKATVEVTEEGSEAAAVTGVQFVPLSINFARIFRANHPFLFYIIDTRNNAILFMGRVKEL